MPKFQLNNEIQYECTFCGLATVGILYVDIVGIDLYTALGVFGNAENTSYMVYSTPNEHTEFEGYTKLIGVEYVLGGTSTVRVALRKPYAGEV